MDKWRIWTYPISPFNLECKMMPLKTSQPWDNKVIHHLRNIEYIHTSIFGFLFHPCIYRSEFSSFFVQNVCFLWQKYSQRKEILVHQKIKQKHIALTNCSLCTFSYCSSVRMSLLISLLIFFVYWITASFLYFATAIVVNISKSERLYVEKW